MLDTDALKGVRQAVQRRAQADKVLLERLRADARLLAPGVRPIKPRTATAMSVVAADGGNNRLQFDPYIMQIIRVVDSFGRQLFLDVISSTTNTDELSRAQFDAASAPQTPLGYLMRDLGVDCLHHLSPMVPKPDRPVDDEVNPGWVLVYRDLCEWAVLYHQIVSSSFASDTLIVRDGLLRSNIFTGDLFERMCGRMREAMRRIHVEERRRVFLVGLAKHSKVLTRNELAMAIEGVLTEDYPCYVEVPEDLERKAFIWPKWAMERTGEGRNVPSFVGGTMHFVKFGSSRHDRIWPVDILTGQTEFAPAIFGFLLADANEGFPVPLYPKCLQSAHQRAALTGFDLEVLQNEIYSAIRQTLPDDQRQVLDAFRLRRDGGNLRDE